MTHLTFSSRLDRPSTIDHRTQSTVQCPSSRTLSDAQLHQLPNPRTMIKGFLTPVTKRHVERCILPTHPQHLFRIIQDVDSYKHFLPLCSHSQIVNKSPDGLSFQATLTVGMSPLFQETYLSNVRLNPTALTVHAESTQSKLFDSLRSQWKLDTVKDSAAPNDECQVNFQVEITTSNPFIVGTLDQVLREVAGQQVAAFAKRCREIPLPPDLQDSSPKQ